jgi:hypothetical protein
VHFDCPNNNIVTGEEEEPHSEMVEQIEEPNTLSAHDTPPDNGTSPLPQYL